MARIRPAPPTIILALPLLAFMACESATGPLALRPPDVVLSAAISDGTHGGPAGFYFLPPMVKSPSYGGVFDPEVAPVVEICAAADCTPPLHASFSMTAGVGSEVVRLEEEDEHYIVHWHAGHTGAEAGVTYRVRVLVDGAVLGYADVAVVSTGREAVAPRSDGSIALVARQTLPLKFRIETGIVGTIVVTPAEATIDVGDTQQFTAALYDLHGEPLLGPTITWSSGDTDVAAVDGDGLALGVAEGSATITASAGPASGSGALTVEGPATPPLCEGGAIRVAWVHGWGGTHTHPQLSWNHLKSEWASYGDSPICIVDVLQPFDLAALAATEADVLLLGNISGGARAYTESELSAVESYVQGGHAGVLITYLLGFQAYDNLRLSTLAGVDASTLTLNPQSITNTMAVAAPSHPLMTRIVGTLEVTWFSEQGHSVPWSSALVSGASIVAGTNNEATAIAYEGPAWNGVFLTGLLEYNNSSTPTRQLLYNSLVWASGGTP
jgi:hypothetical protein